MFRMIIMTAVAVLASSSSIDAGMCDSVESCNAKLLRCGVIDTRDRVVDSMGDSVRPRCVIIVDTPEWVAIDEYLKYEKTSDLHWVGETTSGRQVHRLEPTEEQCDAIGRALKPCSEGPEYPRICLERHCTQAGYVGTGEMGKCTILDGDTYRHFQLSLEGCSHWCFENVPWEECPSNNDNRPTCVNRERPETRYLGGPNRVCVVTTTHPTTRSTLYGVPWAHSCSRLGWRDAIPYCWEVE